MHHRGVLCGVALLSRFPMAFEPTALRLRLTPSLGGAFERDRLTIALAL
jgi:hypothetical protein